mmetsp:Transcript_29453/g.77190  ORF Transcript_29453/g.77190 Transcript_29453/m.77190 type:complete len:241 (-) Transcript_29453:1757-2479(-)
MHVDVVDGGVSRALGAHLTVAHAASVPEPKVHPVGAARDPATVGPPAGRERGLGGGSVAPAPHVGHNEEAGAGVLLVVATAGGRLYLSQVALEGLDCRDGGLDRSVHLSHLGGGAFKPLAPRPLPLDPAHCKLELGTQVGRLLPAAHPGRSGEDGSDRRRPHRHGTRALVDRRHLVRVDPERLPVDRVGDPSRRDGRLRVRHQAGRKVESELGQIVKLAVVHPEQGRHLPDQKRREPKLP